MSNIIRTIEELEKLDPDTFLMADPYEAFPQEDSLQSYDIIGDDIFPLAVIATGEQVRQARRQLEESKK